MANGDVKAILALVKLHIGSLNTDVLVSSELTITVKKCDVTRLK